MTSGCCCTRRRSSRRPNHRSGAHASKEGELLLVREISNGSRMSPPGYPRRAHGNCELPAGLHPAALGRISLQSSCRLQPFWGWARTAVGPEGGPVCTRRNGKNTSPLSSSLRPTRGTWANRGHLMSPFSRPADLSPKALGLCAEGHRPGPFQRPGRCRVRPLHANRSGSRGRRSPRSGPRPGASRPATSRPRRTSSRYR